MEIKGGDIFLIYHRSILMNKNEVSRRPCLGGVWGAEKGLCSMPVKIMTTVRAYTTNRMDHSLPLFISGRILRFMCRWLSIIAVFQERGLCHRWIKNHTKLSYFSMAVSCVCDFIVKVWHIQVPIPIGPQRRMYLIYLKINKEGDVRHSLVLLYSLNIKINDN